MRNKPAQSLFIKAAITAWPWLALIIIAAGLGLSADLYQTRQAELLERGWQPAKDLAAQKALTAGALLGPNLMVLTWWLAGRRQHAAMFSAGLAGLALAIFALAAERINLPPTGPESDLLMITIFLKHILVGSALVGAAIITRHQGGQVSFRLGLILWPYWFLALGLALTYGPAKTVEFILAISLAGLPFITLGTALVLFTHWAACLALLKYQKPPGGYPPLK